MNRVKKTGLLVCIFLFGAGGLFSPAGLWAKKIPGAEAILQKMVRGNQTTAYRGDWVTEVDSLRIWQKIYHDSLGRKRIVFVLPRNLLGREVLEIPPWLYVRKKEGGKFRKREWLFHRPLFSRKVTKTHWRLIRRNYTVSVSPGQKFLHRQAFKLVFRPRFNDRPVISVWVDAQTALLLKVQKSWPDGKILRSSFFKNLLLNPVLDPALFVLLPEQIDSTGFRKTDVFTRLDSLQTRLHFSLLLPRWLPEGFQFQSARRLFFHNREIAHIVYFDGLSTLSLFESRCSVGKSRPPMVHPKNQGGVWEWRTTVGSVGVYLLGELQPPVLKKVLDSLPKASSRKQNTERNLILWVGILIVALVVMTQFLSGKRRTR